MNGICDNCGKSAQLEEFKGLHLCKVCVLDARFKDRYQKWEIEHSFKNTSLSPSVNENDASCSNQFFKKHDDSSNNVTIKNEGEISQCPVVTKIDKRNSPYSVSDKPADKQRAHQARLINNWFFLVTCKLLTVITMIYLSQIGSQKFFHSQLSLETIINIIDNHSIDKQTLIGIVGFIYVFCMLGFFVIYVLPEIFKLAKEMIHCPKLEHGTLNSIKSTFSFVLDLIIFLITVAFHVLIWFLWSLLVAIPVVILIEIIKWPQLLAILFAVWIFVLIVESDTFGEVMTLYLMFNLFKNKDK